MTPTFFTDRNLGRTFPQILRSAGLQVEAHDDHFDDNTPDPDWLLAVGRKGWFALSHNKRIRYTPNEQDAAMRANLGLFILIGVATWPDHARNVVNTIGRIRRFIANHERPFIAKISRPAPSVREGRPSASGDVTPWLSMANWHPH